MANDLTGDFDVVAEFTLGAANRVLAAMHSGGRLPHSWSLKVDDYHRLSHSALNTGVRSFSDVAGRPITNPTAVAQAAAVSGVVPARSSGANGDSPVNVTNVAGRGPESLPPAPESPQLVVHPGQVTSTEAPFRLAPPQHLSGVAQLQMGAPTVSLVDGLPNKVTIHTPVMARYTGDPGTLLIPNYLRGEFQTTISVQAVNSSAGNFINVVLADGTGSAQFVPSWVSPAWDSEPDQLESINKAIENSLKSSFEPSSTPLPSNVLHLRFKTLAAGPALAMLMDLPGGNPSGPPNPGSVNDVFLEDGDDFAFAISEEFVQTMVDGALRQLKAQTDSFTITGHITIIPNPFGDDVTASVSATYDVSLNSVTLSLEDATDDFPNGLIVVTIQGSANTSSVWPDVDFTATQNLALEILDSSWGSTADVIAVGDPSVDLHAPGVTPDWIINKFKPDAVDTVKRKIADFVAQLNPGLQKKLSAKLNLGDFLKTMMNPAPKPGAEPTTEVDPFLAYSSWEISSSGIVLHGTLSVPRWPKPHVEFDYRIVSKFVPLPLSAGEYNALRSWIPGGTIREFAWHQQDGSMIDDDKNRFVFDEKRGMSDIVHLCLTISGRRITASGPVGYETVSAESHCSWRVRVSAQSPRAHGNPWRLPKIALTEKRPSGGMEIVGHMTPWSPPGTAPEYTSNLIVHFPDQESLAALESLPRALQASGRSDTSSAIVAVLNPESFAHVEPVEGILLADDVNAWAEHLEVKGRPATVVLGSNGQVVLRQEGPIASEELAAALRTHLVPGSNSAASLLLCSLVAGHAPPNFLFDSGAGGELTLRKLIGRPVVILFCSPRSAISLVTLEEFERSLHRWPQPPVLLAIYESDSGDQPTRATDPSQQAILIPDADSQIARAYGITIWPTAVFIDQNGVLSSISYGRLRAETIAGAPATKARTLNPSVQFSPFWEGDLA